MNWARGIIVISIVGYLLTGLAQIRPEERGVVRRFGKVIATPGPGLWVGFPRGIDRLDRVAVNSVRQCPVGSDETPIALITGDQNLVAVVLVVEYSVDESRLSRFVIHRDRIDSLIERESESVAMEWATGWRVDELLLAGRTTLASHLLDLLPKRLAGSDLGIVIQRVSVKSIAPPEEVRESFTQVNEAQTAMTTKENQARQDANRRVQDAETARLQLTSQAESARIEKLTAAKADANAFLQRVTQYRKLRETNPNILTAIWWEETGRLLAGMKGRGRIDLLDSHLGPNGLDLSTVLPPKKK